MANMFKNPTVTFLNFLFNALWFLYLIGTILISAFLIVILVISLAGKPPDIHFYNTVSLLGKATNAIQINKDISMDLTMGKVNHIVDYSTNFHGFHTWYLIIFFILFYSASGSVLFIIYQFKKIFNQLIEDKVFTSENIRRIHLIGVAMICLWIIRWIYEFYNNAYFQLYIIQGVSYDVIKNSNFENLLPGFIALILAQIFKYGYQLQVEKDLTI